MKTALVLACDDRFIAYASVAARRIARLASEKFPILLLSDGVSDENKRLARKVCPEISFIEAAHMLDRRQLPVSGRITRAAHLRLFLDEILADMERAVYVDSDVTLLADITPLLALRPTAAAVIAAHDLHIINDGAYLERLQMSAPYFNSGVMVLDLAATRREQIFVRALQFAHDNLERCAMHDQDALNAVLNGAWQTLDWRWNAMNYLSKRMPKAPFLRHFSGSKPWGTKKVGVERRFVDQWRRELADSPWPGSFQEEAYRYRIRRVSGPIAAATALVARPLGAALSGKGDDKTRFIRGFAQTLAASEAQAAAGALADWLPHTNPRPGKDGDRGPGDSP